MQNLLINYKVLTEVSDVDTIKLSYFSKQK